MEINTFWSTLSSIASKIDSLKTGLFLFGVFLMWVFVRANNSGKLDWTDLVTAKGGNKVSATKLLQLLGGFTATWVVIYQTTTQQLSTELFFAYLLYVASIEGYSKFMAARYGVNNNEPPIVDTIQKEVKTVTITNTPSHVPQPEPVPMDQPVDQPPVQPVNEPQVYPDQSNYPRG